MPVVNLKSQLAAAMRLFRVPADNPDLTRAQFDAFSKQIPLLYFILMSNTIAVAYTYVNVAPDWLTLIVPSVLTVLAALRTYCCCASGISCAAMPISCAICAPPTG